MTKISFSGYKGMTREHNLERLNIVTGKNGSGKTAIGSAIHIALKGKHPYLGETLSAIRKECGDEAMFRFENENIRIQRGFVFSDKTEHSLVVDGVERKIKEGQGLIDDIYPDSITRLDIGKFIKMNDLQRGELLANLFGSGKESVKEIARSILHRFYQADPESIYVIKYRLSSETGSYDTDQFIASMEELYKEKNPLIMEAINNVKEIILGDGKVGEVDMSKHLDSVHDRIRELRNSTVLEKRYAQQAYAEMSSDIPDQEEIVASVEASDKEIAAIQGKIDEMTGAIMKIKANMPGSERRVVEDDISTVRETIEAKKAELVDIEKEKESTNNMAELQKKLKACTDHSSWKRIYDDNVRTIESVKKEIESLNGKLKKESDESIDDLTKATTDYNVIRGRLATPGECSKCGTIISKEKADATKKEIETARKLWEKATSEMEKRNQNKITKGKVAALNKRLKEAQDKIKSLKDTEPPEPTEVEAEVSKQISGLDAALFVYDGIIKDKRGEIQTLERTLMNLEVELDKLNKYQSVIEPLLGLLSLYDADANNPIPALQDAREALVSKRDEEDAKKAEMLGTMKLIDKITDSQIRIANLQSKIDTLGKLLDTVRAYKNKIIEERIEPVKMVAKKYYPNKNDDIVLSPTDIGVIRDGVFIPQDALSAGENLALISSMLIAIMETSSASPNYLFIDAAEIDAANMHAMMELLSQSHIDMILVAHHNNIDAPKGWNHIKL